MLSLALLSSYFTYIIYCRFIYSVSLQENTYLYRTSLYLAASASAEFFADIALSPMEAIKVRIQTSEGFANTLREGVPKLWRLEGISGYVIIISHSLCCFFFLTLVRPCFILSFADRLFAEVLFYQAFDYLCTDIFIYYLHFKTKTCKKNLRVESLLK